MNECVICKIISGAIPSWIVYRDTQAVCFLPKEVEAYGHTVIAPIQHYPDIYASTTDSLAMLMTTARKLALHYRQQIGASGVNLLHASGASAQQSVAHMHIHLIPRFDADGLDAWPVFPGTTLEKDDLLKKLKFAEPGAAHQRLSGRVVEKRGHNFTGSVTDAASQPPRLRLAPLCCHPPLPESRG
jgi:histidine triad (HIT) family protein